MISTQIGLILKCSLLAMLLSAFAFRASSEQVLTLLTEDYPPLNYLNEGKLTGAGVDVVTEIQTLLKSKVKIEVMPWKRAYLRASGAEKIGIFSLVRSPERERLFKWVGPIATKRYAFYGLKSEELYASKIKDLTSYKIGVQIGSRLESYLEEQGFANVQAVNSPEQNMSKLLVGRIDLWYTSYATLMAYAKAASKGPELFREVFVTEKEQLYIGFSHITENALVDNWQRAYETLYTRGVIYEIYQRREELYMYPDFVPQN